MSFNDEREKLELAEAYLLKYSPDSQEFEAALEHVLWSGNRTATRDAAKAVLQRIITARGSERRAMQKLKAIARWPS